MRFYNVDMKGKFFVQRGTSNPASAPSEEGRLFYNETDEILRIHDSSGWDAIVTASNAPSVIGGDFLRKDQNDVTLFDLTVNRSIVSTGEIRGGGTICQLGPGTSPDDYLRVGTSYFQYVDAGVEKLRCDNSGNLQLDGTLTVSGASGTINGQTIWTAGNDGAGSGLDADLLDGQSSVYYRNAGNMNAGTLPVARLSGTYNININGTAEYA